MHQIVWNEISKGFIFVSSARGVGLSDVKASGLFHDFGGGEVGAAFTRKATSFADCVASSRTNSL
jgi:hypothetical protein